MTDITELAHSLKAAANITADAIDRLKAFPGDELINLSQHEGEHVDIDIATLNQWYELSSPANIRALVEALERKEEQRANWFQMAQKLGENLDTAEKRIAELESRTVTVKLPEPPGPMSVGARTVYFGIVADVVSAFQYGITAAGIKVEVE